MTELQVEGIPIYYHQQGSGEPLVLLHSGLGTGGDFAAVIPTLAHRYTVLTPDRPGYGRSGRGVAFERQTFFQRQAHLLNAFLETATRPPAFLWGWSDGAVIALWMAVQRPDLVRAVVVEAGHLYGRKPARSFLEQHAHPESLAAEEQAHLAQKHGNDWAEVCRHWGQMWSSLDDAGGELYDGLLPSLHTPVLILLGTDDPHIPPAEGQALAGRLPQARLVLFPDGGHALHLGPTQARCLALVEDFFASLRGRRSR